MITRTKIADVSTEAAEPEKEPEGLGLYYDTNPTEFIRSGCTTLDGILCGGWALGRISNVIGDASTGKTLLAIEACANFIRQYPKGRVYYRESEAAFDREFARKLGMPVEHIDFLPDHENPDKGEFATVEDFSRDLSNIINEFEGSKEPGLYITDSLDGLSDEAEKELEIGKGTYGAGKAKALSQMFRQRSQGIAKTRMHLMVISQIRDKIGVTFGRKFTRSGGRALDFYASQKVILSEVSKIQVERGKVKRPIGVSIRAKNDKSKVGMPYRECQFPIMFGYGIDDVEACVRWLDEVSLLGEIGVSIGKDAASKYIAECNKLSDEAYFARAEWISGITREVWDEVESRFSPKRSKYGN